MKAVYVVLPVVVVLAGPGIFADEITPMQRPLTVSGFEEIARQKNVTVYQDVKSPIIRVAAEGIIEAPPAEVQQTLLDYEKQKGVVKRVSESEILGKGSNWLVVYQHLNLPVISDRDFTLRVVWGADGDVLWIKYQAMKNVGPEERKDVVRVTHDEGSWQLTPVKGGRATLARFQMSMDLAGIFPRFMARSGAGREVPSVFESMRKLVVMEEKGGASCQSKYC